MASRLERSPSVERVSSLAEVVEIILTFLPAKALFMCAQVCRLWRDTARRIIRSRQRLGWLSFVFHHGVHGTPCTSKLSMEILGRRIVEFLDELPLVPAACILLVSRCTEYADAKKDEIKGLVTAVKGCLPDSCALIGCVGAGIIGTGEGGFSEEVEMAEGVALLLMPQIEGVSAKVINLNITEVKNNRTFKSRWEKSLKIPSDGTVKCAFLLAKGDTYNLDVIGKVASGIWKVCNNEEDDKSEVVIIGGLVESFLMVDNEVRNAGVVGLAIAGDVEAISMVHHGETAEGVQQSLKQLKKSGISCEKNTACFMVTCIGRGEKFYSAKNVETGIFRQEFPGIPVVGFFGNGELGLDLHSCEGKLERDGHFLHSYSSVFCLCSLSPQSNDSSTDEGTVTLRSKASDSKEKPCSSHKSV
ncbi:hypothetical protein ACROYT_G010447 [Oculina patagonica]